MARSASVMVINDGAAPALVACLMAERVQDVVVWVPPASSGLRTAAQDDESVLQAIQHQQEVLGWLRTLVGRDSGAHSASAPALQRAAALLQAAGDALALGCSTVVWPVVCSSDVAAIEEAGELASGVTRLTWIAQPRLGGVAKVPGPDFRIETPFADLTMAQIADLAEDLRAPLELCIGTAAVAGARAAQTPAGRSA